MARSQHLLTDSSVSEQLSHETDTLNFSITDQEEGETCASLESRSKKQERLISRSVSLVFFFLPNVSNT